MKKILIALFIATTLISCSGEKTVDASTDETLKSSVEEMMASMDESKKQEFQTALQYVMMASIDMEAVMKGEISKDEIDYKSGVDGKTADEIIDEYNKLKAENKKQ